MSLGGVGKWQSVICFRWNSGGMRRILSGRLVNVHCPLGLRVFFFVGGWPNGHRAIGIRVFYFYTGGK